MQSLQFEYFRKFIEDTKYNIVRNDFHCPNTYTVRKTSIQEVLLGKVIAKITIIQKM
jgi:hypothetical protein